MNPIHHQLSQCNLNHDRRSSIDIPSISHCSVARSREIRYTSPVGSSTSHSSRSQSRAVERPPSAGRAPGTGAGHHTPAGQAARRRTVTRTGMRRSTITRAAIGNEPGGKGQRARARRGQRAGERGGSVPPTFSLFLSFGLCPLPSALERLHTKCPPCPRSAHRVCPRAPARRRASRP